MPADIDNVDGVLKVSGELTFSTVPTLLTKAAAILTDSPQGAAVDVDLTAVSHADSAGLALLIEWHRLASDTGRSLHFHHLPKQMLALARVSNLESLLVSGSQQAVSTPR